MKGSGKGRLFRTPGIRGMWLVFVASPAFAQISPLTTQSLFFDQASNAHRGNYLEVDAGLIYNDNVDLVPNGPGDTLAMIGLVGDTARNGPRLDYSLVSDLSLVKYLHSEFPTQPFGFAYGTGEFKIVPGFFSWTAMDSYNEAQLSPYAPLTPGNLEAINYFRTGPRLTLRPTLRTTVVVDGIYSIIDSSSKSPEYVNINNHAYGGDITISRAFSSIASVYITGVEEKVEFSDTTVNTDFREESISGGFRLVDARTSLDVAGGYTKLYTTTLIDVQSIVGLVQRPQNQAPSGVTWNLNLSRLIRPTQRVSLTATQQVTDAANLFNLSVNQAVPTTVAYRLNSGEPFTYRTFGAAWRLQETRTTFEIDGNYITQRYSATPSLDVDQRVIGAVFTRQLSAVLNWDIGASYEHDDYASGGRVNTVNAITSLRWRLGQRLSLRFLYAHYSYEPNGYRNNQVGVIAAYGIQGAGTGSAAAPALTPGNPLQPNAPFNPQPYL